MHYVGFDVSDDWLDVAVLNRSGELIHEEQLPNEKKAIRKLVRSLVKDHGVDIAQSLFCLEPTGHYSYALIDVLVAMKVPAWVAHPFHIKQVSSDLRGKSDKLDAVRIASYAYRYKDKARLITEDQIRFTELKQLIMKREQLVKDRSRVKAQLSHVNKHMQASLQRTFDSVDGALKKVLDKQLEKIEQLIERWLGADPHIQQQFDLLCSIPGIGDVVAMNFLAVTDGFLRFSDPKALACHCGVAPFEHSSGKTIKARSRTSPRSNSTLRPLLKLSALNASRFDPGLKRYYERKLAEGKPEQLVLNAIAGKLIDRIYAVLRRGTPYLKTPLAPFAG